MTTPCNDQSEEVLIHSETWGAFTCSHRTMMFSLFIVWRRLSLEPTSTVLHTHRLKTGLDHEAKCDTLS